MGLCTHLALGNAKSQSDQSNQAQLRRAGIRRLVLAAIAAHDRHDSRQLWELGVEISIAAMPDLRLRRPLA